MERRRQLLDVELPAEPNRSGVQSLHEPGIRWASYGAAQRHGFGLWRATHRGRASRHVLLGSYRAGIQRPIPPCHRHGESDPALRAGLPVGWFWSEVQLAGNLQLRHQGSERGQSSARDVLLRWSGRQQGVDEVGVAVSGSQFERPAEPGHRRLCRGALSERHRAVRGHEQQIPGEVSLQCNRSIWKRLG